MAVSRLLLVGWDCAEPRIVEAMRAAGRLPHLAGLIARGRFGTVRTTVPDTSLAAWTAAMTGVSPGRHGLVNFVRRPPGEPRLVLLSAADRLAPTLQRLATRAGLRVASLGLPGSWPPASDAGLCISGFDSPLSRRTAAAGHMPPALFDWLAERGLAWPRGELDELAVGAGWHERALPRLLDAIERKCRVAEALFDREEIHLASIVFSESDTVAHHFWAFADPASPRHRPRPDLAQAIWQVYEALDAALGRLLARCGEDAAVMVLSDHGARGASDRVVYLNRWLAEQGLLRFAPGRGALARAAGRLRDAGGRWLPAPFKEAILRSPLAPLVLATDGLARFGGIDLSASQAFSDELPQNPGIWIQLAGREPGGRVRPGPEYEALRDEIAERLLAWRDPDSQRPVVARVWRREEATPGPAMERSPDLLVELSSWPASSTAPEPVYRLTAAPSGGRSGPSLATLPPQALVAGKGTGTSGAHAPDGILVLAGPGLSAGPGPADARLVDICPTALALLGFEAAPHMDGRALIRPAADLPLQDLALDGAIPGPVAAARDAAGERAVRRRLEDLGYL